MGKVVFFIGIVFFCFGCKEEAFPSIDIVKKGPFSWDNKEECTIVFNLEGNSVELPAKIKHRGGMSAIYKKNSFSFELEKKYQFFDLPKDDDWILNASYIDKTFMRHKINYDLYREMHPNNIAALSTHINIFINGAFNGLFLLTEEINGKRVGLNKKDTLSMLFKDPLFLFKERIENAQDPDNYYQQKFPKLHKRDQTYYIEQFRTLLFEASDEKFDNQIGNWVDIQNIIDWHLLLLFSNNGDGIMKNFYLYKKDSNTPFRIAIWDYDHTFGRDGDNELNMMDRPLRWKQSILFVRLLMSKTLNYRKQLEARWKELRDSGLFSLKHLERQMDAIDQNIHETITENSKKWPIKGYWYHDDNDYDKEKEIIKLFIPLRLSQLDKEFNYINTN